MCKMRFVVLCLVVFLGHAQPARILCFFPVPFHSHQSVFRVITEALLQRGHQLVVLAPVPFREQRENLTQLDVYDKSYQMFEDGLKNAHKYKNNIAMSALEFWGNGIYPTMIPIADIQFGTESMQEIINDENQRFDVVLIESVIPTSFLAAVKYDVPVIQVSSFFGSEENFFTLGAAVHPLLLPEYNFDKLGNYNFFERIKYSYIYAKLRYMGWQAEKTENAVIKKYFGSNAPTVSELKKRVQILLLNVHHFWDNNRPVPPSVVYMGALQLKRPKPLPNELQAYLDSSKMGVVYVSLGSKLQFSDLPSATLEKFFKVFKSLPYNFLVKWNGQEYKSKPQNVRLERWLPQNDLLHHRNIRGFIMQAGLQSTDEAIAAKVPLLAFPAFADQMYNAQKYEQLGIGLQLDIDHVDVKTLNESLLRIVEDPSFRENIKTVSRICSEQREGGLDRAVYWVEYVAKHGAPHLKSPLADVTLAEFLMLDVLSAVLLTIVTVLIILVYIVKYLLAESRLVLLRKKND